MANSTLPKCCARILLFLSIFALFTHATPVNIPLSSVSDLLIQSALDSLNDNSPTRHTYKSGNLISAQKLLEPPYVIYRLTLNLEPNCDDESSCPREACAIDLRQHEHGVIDVQRNSIQCMYLYPQSDQAENQQTTFQDAPQDGTSIQEQDTMENMEKRTNNSSLQLVHEVQTITDGNDRPFIAVRAIERNYCAGCPYELNPELPGLAAYGEQIVQSMDDTGRSDFKHKVVSIVRVTRAVPPGSNVVIYDILLEIGETNCLRIGMSVRRDCSLLPNVPIKLCHVTFEQRPWQQDSQKIVRNNCTDLPDVYNELGGNLAQPLVTSDSVYIISSSMRNTDSASSTTDNNEQISQQTDKNENLSTSVSTSNDDFFDIVETTSSTGISVNEENTKKPITEETQKKIVIQRNNDKIKIEAFNDKYKDFDDFLENIDFDMPIKHRDPEPTDRERLVNEEIIRPEIVVRTNYDGSNDVSGSNDEEISEKRARRSTIDGTNEEPEIVSKLAQKVVDELDEIDNDDKKRVLLDIVDWKEQKLADDTIYYVTLKVATSNCFEGMTDCSDDTRESAKICKAQIQTNQLRSLETAKVLQSQCFHELNRRDRSLKRQIPGGTTQRNIDDPDIKKYAEKGFHEFSKTYEGEREPFFVEILEATSQVVSGTLYKIKVRFGQSTCSKGEKENCQLSDSSEPNIYLISVWSQPWKDNDKPKITIESMSDINAKRVRRSSQLVGAPTPADSEDPEIREYAEKGLTKYTETFGGDNEPYLVEIVKSTKQVVSGMLYKINVRLGDSTCPKGVKKNCQLKSNSRVQDYEITVWSQPWIDHGHPDIKIKLSSEKPKIFKRSLRGKNYSAKMLKLGKTIENERAFVRFREEHGKTYESEEEANYRFKVFQENMKKIEELRDNEAGTAEYGATIFADLTADEFRAKHLGLRQDLRSDNDISLPMADIPNIELPEEFDWRHQNVVTTVKNQGSCGSCWAFAVTGNVEALNAIKYGKLLSLSEQELVDCDKFDEGCEGGLPTNAYRAIEQLGGLELENDYPYDGKDETCHFDEKTYRVKIVSGLNITTNETQMAQWLVKNGPISIGINANAMQFYMGGVSHPFKFLCNGDNLDHGVLIVGYGIHTYPIFNKKMPYWIIKNSWGPRWGEQGYYRVYRGDGTCGLNRMATSAVIA